MKKMIFATLILSVIGILDAGYLTYEHFSDSIPPCSVSVWSDCGKVLQSNYAEFYGVPVALLGLLFYAFILKLSLIRLSSQKVQKWAFSWVAFHQTLRKKWTQPEDLYLEMQLIATTAGIVFSLYFVYLQLAVIQSICIYCMISAINSTILFGLTVYQRFFYQK